MTPKQRRLWDRFGGRCAYCCARCKAFGDTSALGATIDHFVPQSAGGVDDMRNLRLACRACNNRKGNTLPDAWLRMISRRDVVQPTAYELRCEAHRLIAYRNRRIDGAVN